MRKPIVLAALLLTLSGALSAQQLPSFGQADDSTGKNALPTLERDPQAIQVLMQTLTTAGGIAALSAIQNYTATGTVNYYWGDGEQGSVVVKGRGTGQFRIDASLPEGTRSWAVNNGNGWVREADGTTDVIFTHNALNLGSLTFPSAFLSSALQDSSMSIVYVGLEVSNGTQVHHIRAQKFYPHNADPAGLFARLSKREFFIDAHTFYLVSSEDMTHPRDNATVDYVHRVEFSDYRKVNSMLVPFSIIEYVQGQPSETFQLNQINFNVGLQDSDFAQ